MGFLLAADRVSLVDFAYASVRGSLEMSCKGGFEHLPRCEPTPYVPPTAGDWQCYAARNPDVAAALGRKVGALARHFYRHGFAEGRSPYCEADRGRYTCAFPHCDE